MDARALIETLKARGVELRVNGDRIQAEAPEEPDSETKVLLDEVRQHKEEILEALTQETTPEALAASILAENTLGEATRILDFWKRTFGMDLDRVRERSAEAGVSEHLKRLREWQGRFRGRLITK